MRRFLVALTFLALALAPAASAHGGAVADATEALGSAPVYVDPDAEPTLTDAEASALAQRLVDAPQPMFVAVLSKQDDAAHDVVHELVDGVGKPGTYVAVSGGEFGVHSTELPHERSEELAAAANASTGPLASKLNSLVTDVQAAPSADDATPWGWVVAALVALALVAAIVTTVVVRRRKPVAFTP